MSEQKPYLKVCSRCHGKIKGGCIKVKKDVMCISCFRVKNDEKRRERQSAIYPVETVKYRGIYKAYMGFDIIKDIHETQKDIQPGWEFRDFHDVM